MYSRLLMFEPAPEMPWCDGVFVFDSVVVEVLSLPAEEAMPVTDSGGV